MGKILCYHSALKFGPLLVPSAHAFLEWKNRCNIFTLTMLLPRAVPSSAVTEVCFDVNVLPPSSQSSRVGMCSLSALGTQLQPAPSADERGECSVFVVVLLP